MFEYSQHNMRLPEARVRMVIATCLLVYAVLVGNVAFTALSLLVYHTAYKKYCFVYALLNVNKKFSMENYYLSFIPRESPSEVIIFDSKGFVLFKNTKAEAELGSIRSLKDIGFLHAEGLIHQENSDTIQFVDGDKHYQIELKGISKEGLLLAYFSDVSELVTLNKEIEDTQREIIYRMGEIGESRSKETGNHVKRVALYSEKLALLCGLPEEEVRMLKLASPMHDIGKVAIPDSILKAPRKLTDEEFEIMKTHAAIGYDMLKGSNHKLMQAAAIVAHEHHEKFDGSGYPQGLKKNEIHIFGRITAIADVFDALLSKRVYKEKWTMKEVLAMLHQESGKQFDPRLIQLFVRHIDEFTNIHKQYAS